MNKNVRNIVVFVLVAVFIFAGLFSKDLFKNIYTSAKNLIKGDKSVAERIDKFIDEVENTMTDKLSYHDEMMDINSFVISRTGQDYVVKDGTVVVKTKSGYLANGVPKIDSAVMQKYADSAKELYEYTKSKEIPFLYVMAPRKGYSMEYPAGTENYIAENCQEYLGYLKDRNVPYLEIRELMEEQGISEEDAFFVTDHHWRPNTAFWATGEICKALNKMYGYTYDNAIFDLKNYNIKTYENWFLGSQGKKVGTDFTVNRADDIDLITPKFETNLTVAQPLRNSSKTGTFTETLISMSYITTKDYYKYNPYAMYTGGDFHIQTIENHNNPDGPDVLVIRDSFACASTPFLALTARNTHILDLRNYAGMYGPRVESVQKYIDEMDPDYVIVLYNGIDKDDLKYNFK